MWKMTKTVISAEYFQTLDLHLGDLCIIKGKAALENPSAYAHLFMIYVSTI